MYLILAAQAASSAPDATIAVYQLTDFLVKYLTPLIAVGAFSMAFIELWKKLLDKRTKFHARRWVDWLMHNAASANAVANRGEEALTQQLQLCTGAAPEEAMAAARDLIRLRGLPRGYAPTRKPAHSVFALELERMMGSIQEAADIVLANPPQYESLYRVLTTGANRGDIESWFRHGPSALLDAANLPEDQQKAEVKRQSELFARLRQTVKGKLDGFQLYTSDSWTNWNQLAANITGIIVMLVSLMFSRWSTTGAQFSWDAIGNSFTPSMVPISLVGGILSPVAKDLVSALQRVKGG
ncbi:MAG TPA: hypothetical protein VF105_07315 [Gemmatimonadaceae bacterium]